MRITVEELIGQGLVPEDIFTRLVNRIAKEQDVPHEFAVRIMDQALAFLATCASASESLSPSETVDVGWHAFILYTREYAAFCDRIAGRFIHHEPTDTGLILVSRTHTESMSATTRAIRKAGYAVDLPLWGASAACNQCTEGCTHSGGDTGCHHHPVRTDTVPA